MVCGVCAGVPGGIRTHGLSLRSSARGLQEWV